MKWKKTNRREFIQRASGLFVPAAFGILAARKAAADHYYAKAASASGVAYVSGSAMVSGASLSSPTIASLVCDAAADVLVVVASMKFAAGPAPTVSSATFGASGLTFFGKATPGDFEMALEVWYLVNPTASTDTLTVNWSAANNYVSITANFYSGAHQTTPLSGLQTTGWGSRSSSSLTITSAATSLVQSNPVAYGASPQVNLTPGTDATERAANDATNNIACWSLTKAGAASVNIGWSFGSAASCQDIGFSIDAA